MENIKIKHKQMQKLLKIKIKRKHNHKIISIHTIYYKVSNYKDLLLKIFNHRYEIQEIIHSRNHIRFLKIM